MKEMLQELHRLNKPTWISLGCDCWDIEFQWNILKSHEILETIIHTTTGKAKVRCFLKGRIQTNALEHQGSTKTWQKMLPQPNLVQMVSKSSLHLPSLDLRWPHNMAPVPKFHKPCPPQWNGVSQAADAMIRLQCGGLMGKYVEALYLYSLSKITWMLKV